MKILILHNQYKQSGGEDTVVALEAEYLARAGHQVYSRFVSNDEVRGLLGQVRAAVEVVGSPASARRVALWINEIRPDVVHIHNFFPRLSPIAHRTAAGLGVAVVQTLHNFRLVCASAMFLRDGHICESCLGNHGAPAVVHRCYRGSVLGSMAVVAMQHATARSQSWLDSVDRFIALTDFGRNKFLAAGLPAEKLVVKPNFVPDLVPRATATRLPRALFVGRLSPEKGIRDLIAAWRTFPDVGLDVIGDGPDLTWAKSAAPAHVTFFGKMDQMQVLRAMEQASVLVFPSRWYEGLPMTLIEAMSIGTPIVASRLGAVAEILDGRPFARLFAPGNIGQMVAATREILAGDLPTMSAMARKEYHERYTPDANIRRLEQIYHEAIAAARQRTGQP